MQRGLQCTGVHCKIGCDTKSGPLNHAFTLAENDVVGSLVEVAVTSDEAANWFWNMLEQAGYELW